MYFVNQGPRRGQIVSIDFDSYILVFYDLENISPGRLFVNTKFASYIKSDLSDCCPN